MCPCRSGPSYKRKAGASDHHERVDLTNVYFKIPGFYKVAPNVFFLFGILFRYSYLYYIIALHYFLLMHLKVKKDVFNFVLLMNEI